MGEILVNGKKRNENKFRSMAGYVDQEDLLLDTLTVRETLMFSAQLRLPESVPYTEKLSTVDRTLEILGLSHVANSRIGGGGVRGISGGEKRRVSIGVELVTSPSVLFLDEPTSGLDSYNAFMVVKTLTSLARDAGKTIIFTIHQPRSDVFQLFDDVLVLTKGNVLYFGAASTAASYLESKGMSCPLGYNIADHLLDLAISTSAPRLTHSFDQSTDSEGLRNRTKTIPPSLEKESIEVFRVSIDDIDDTSSTLSNTSAERSMDENCEALYNVSWITQLTRLMSRSSKALWRKPSLLLAHLTISIVLGIFLGALYYQSNSTLGGFQNRLGSVFFLLALIGFSGLSVIGSFTEEKLLYMRERSNGFYGPIPFFISRIIFDIFPLRILPVRARLT